MTGLLLIAHAPLASALKAVAEHTFPHCASQLAVLDVGPEMSPEQVVLAARGLIRDQGHAATLVLTDVFGATPCNAALQLAHGDATVGVVSGVNVPMLWRSLCYAHESLDALKERATQGGSCGVMPCQSESTSSST